MNVCSFAELFGASACAFAIAAAVASGRSRPCSARARPIQHIAQSGSERSAWWNERAASMNDVVVQERQALVVEGLRVGRGGRDLLVYRADVLSEGDRALEERRFDGVAARAAQPACESGCSARSAEASRRAERDGDSTFHRDSSEAVR